MGAAERHAEGQTLHAGIIAWPSPATQPSLHAGSAVGTPKSTGLSARGGSLGLDLKIWQVQFQQLELVKQIGEGSFGRVYLAK